MDLKATLEVKSTGLGDDVDKGAERGRHKNYGCKISGEPTIPFYSVCRSLSLHIFSFRFCFCYFPKSEEENFNWKKETHLAIVRFKKKHNAST